MKAREVAGPLAFVAGALLLFPLQARIDAGKPVLPSSLLYTPDRRLMQVIACGHGPLLADLVWIQSINYVIQEFHSGGTHIEHLYALFDVMTELDPNFVDAYVMGSILLSAVGNEPERALDLLEKGEGRLEDRDGKIVEVTTGKVHPEHKERWRLLNETAAIYLVSFAAYAPTLEERYAELRMAGRLYLYADARYPRDRYPDRPDWYKQIGDELANRELGKKFQDFDPESYYRAVGDIWLSRVLATPESSPLRRVYERRLAEIQARLLWQQMTARIEKYREKHGAPPARLEDLDWKDNKVPGDPLGVGWFLVDGKVVAPALDAALLERGLAHDVTKFHRAHDHWPESRAALLELGHREVPAWVWVDYLPTTGDVRVEARPELVQPRKAR